MKSKFWDWDKEPILEGIFVGQIANVGRFKKRVFIFKVDEKRISVWGTVMLLRGLYSIPFGVKIRIEFLGWFQEDEMKHKGREFKIDILEEI